MNVWRGAPWVGLEKCGLGVLVWAMAGEERSAAPKAAMVRMVLGDCIESTPFSRLGWVGTEGSSTSLHSLSSGCGETEGAVLAALDQVSK